MKIDAIYFCDHCSKLLEKGKYMHVFKFQYKFRYLCDDCLKEMKAFFNPNYITPFSNKI